MAFQLAQFLAQSTSGMGVLGAIVGGSGAAAKNYKSYQEGEISKADALKDVSKEASGAGVATAISAAATGIVGGGLIISLITALAVATTAKYAWDRTMENILADDENPNEELEDM